MANRFKGRNSVEAIFEREQFDIRNNSKKFIDGLLTMNGLQKLYDEDDCVQWGKSDDIYMIEVEFFNGIADEVRLVFK